VVVVLARVLRASLRYLTPLRARLGQFAVLPGLWYNSN